MSAPAPEVPTAAGPPADGEAARSHRRSSERPPEPASEPPTSVLEEETPSPGAAEVGPAPAPAIGNDTGPDPAARLSTLRGVGPATAEEVELQVRDPASSTTTELAAGRERRRPQHTWRFVRAYWTTFVVIFSYSSFFFLGRFLGDRWVEGRVGEVHARNARRVERTIVELQGLFIKVGQLLSIMANFLPAQFRSGLEGLQDQVPPRRYDEIRDRVEDELGKPISAIFARFDEEPIASASLGQVHEAWLRDGTHVAVKVQHPDIDEIVRLDLGTIRRIMTIVTVFVPVQGLDAYYHQIRAMISEELDFLGEVRNITRIADNFLHEPKVSFPRPLPALCTKRVMVTSFTPGIKVGDVAALDAAGVDRKALARQIVQVFCQQIFVDGVYHADPHPGNMLVGPEGELVLLDFGAVAELSKEMREGIPEFLESVIRRDTESIIKSLRKMGFLSKGENHAVSEKVIEYFHQRFQDEVKLESLNLKDIKIDPQKGIEDLLDLRKMNIGLRELSGTFHVPRDFVLLERTLLLLTGVCTELDPEMNPMEVVRPYLSEFVLGNRDWAQIALDAAKDMALRAITIPEDLGKYLRRANRGEAELNVRGLPQAAQLVYAGMRQLVYAALAIAAGYAALELHLAGRQQLAEYCLMGAAGAALVLFASLILTRVGRRSS